MADTINVPGVGPTKKPLVFGGIAVLVGILAVAYYRHSKNKAATPAADATQQDPNAIDPATGLTYGEEAAGIQAGDLAGAGTPYGDTSGIIGYDAQGNPVYADQVGYGPSPSFTTNGNWAQAAEQYLVATTGADAGTVAAALGTYIAGQPLTDAQAQIVQSAIAFFGQPPQAGSNGYPPSLRLSGTSGTTGGSTGTGGSGDSGTGGTNPGGPPTGVTPPPTSGGGSSWAFPAPTGLKSSSISRTGYRISWSAVRGPQGQTPGSYTVATFQTNGVKVDQFTVGGTSTAEYGAGGKGLHPGWTYHTNVWANGGPKAPPHATVTVKLKS